MHGKKILLINPPGKEVYIRDYYCSKTSKSNYLFQPVDLLVLSGRLAEKYDVSAIDAIADRLNANRCYDAIEKISPDIIISLIGSASLAEDLLFLEKIKNPKRRIIVSGDVTLEKTGQWLGGKDFLDAVILDFSSEDIIHYINGDYGLIKSMVYKTVDTVVCPDYSRPMHEEFTLPVPRHELFNSPNYRFPFVKHRNFATVLTDYGCPFKCSFCVMSTIGYRYRNIENVMDELRYLKELGKKEVFFIDQTFGINKKRLFKLCVRIKGENLGLGWVCYSRVDIIDEEKLKNMKEAGCHTIIFGVESSSEIILKKYNKGYTKDSIRKAFKLCKDNGIRTVATFIIGLPEETEETANETIEFLKEIDCDFASFNVAVPRQNTPLREESIRSGLISEGTDVMDQGGSTATMPTRYLTAKQVLELKRNAVLKFYMRPAYLWKRLKGISSLFELKEQVYEGYQMLRNL